MTSALRPISRRSLCPRSLFAAALLQLVPLALAQSTRPAPDTGESEPVALPAFDVTSSRDVGYGARDSMSATRMAVDLDKTPTTVIVLDQEFLKDTAALDSNAAVQYISGMNTASVAQSGQVAVRGFNQGGINFRDGLPQGTAPNASQLTNVADMERIEVIKGPEGVLYGSQSNGGVINAVSKQPLAFESTWAKFTVGSWNTYRVDLDNTGPLRADKRLLYRVIASYQDGDAQAYGSRKEDKFFSASFTAAPDKLSTVRVKFSYAEPRFGATTNPWFANGSSLSTFLPVRNNFDESDEVVHQWQYLTTVTYERRFGDNWRLRLAYRENETNENKSGYNKSSYTFVDAAGKTVGTVGTSTTNISFSDPRWVDIIANRTRKHDIYYQYDYGPYADLIGHLKLGPTVHNLLLSLQYQDTIISAFEDMASYPSTSVIHPVHYDNPLAVAGVAKPNTSTESSKPNASAALADNVSLFSDRLILAGGIRNNSVNTFTFNRLTNKGTELHTTAQSYKAGIVYRPKAGLSLYYNYADTFTPISGTNYLGEAYLPEYGISHEGGVKLDLLDGRITGTASYFNLKQTNVPESIVVNPLTGQIGNDQVGWVQAKGEEFDLALQPIARVTMTLAYGNINSFTDKGVRQRNVSQGANYKSLVKYTFARTGFLNGLSLGGGYVFTNKRAGDATSTFYLPAYETFNAFLIYQRRNWRFQVNGSNLANSKFSGLSSVNNIYIYTGTPRTVMSSIEYRF